MRLSQGCRPRRVRGRARTLVTLAALSIGACGGSTAPGEKTCQQDPTQAKCIANNNPPTTLRGLASAKGRSFGVSVDATFFGTNNAAYDAVVASEFNLIVAGNVMKWSSIHRDSRYSYRWTSPDAMVAFAQANGMKVRGHTLVWYQQNPTWLTNTTWDPETLKVVLKEHIDSVVGHYKGKVLAWDVVNEAFNDGTGSLRVTGSPWATTLGAGYIDLAFQEARAADPAALLFYNDYNLETPGLKQDSVFARISGMKTRGIPIDGIGFQAHFQVNADATGVPSKETLVATFNRFAALGLKIHITELDIRVRTPGATSAELAAQNQGFTNVTAACLAVPACEAMVVWGLNDGESWVNTTFPGYGQPLLFDDSYSRKATYNAVSSALSAP
jgi:endo-1,4-beta-xylanase